MNRARVQRLRAEIRSDREAIAQWLGELTAVELGPQADRGSLAQVAWALHHAYSSVEAILERTMRAVEGSVPAGPEHQREILDAAALEIDGVRPPLLRRSTAIELHDLRAFRHFVRHAYAVQLDRERLESLQERAQRLRPRLEEDLDRLDGWLEGLARAVEREG